MAEQQWFYRSAAEWDAICQRLKRTACPHCQGVGMLIQGTKGTKVTGNRDFLKKLFSRVEKVDK